MPWLERRSGGIWWIAYRDENRKIKRIRGYTDKAATRQKLAKWETARAHGAEGLVDIYAEHRSKPLASHISDFVADRRARSLDPMYVYVLEKRLNRLVAECGWKTLADITTDSFCQWREKLPKLEDGRPKIGPRSQNQFLETARTFCGWTVKRKRWPMNPLVDVAKVEESGDVRRARRALTEEEVAALLAAAPARYKPVYRFILRTGLRRQEVRDLLWGDVRLNAPSPFLALRAKATKARRADTIPLRADLAQELREMRGDAADDQAVFVRPPKIEKHRRILKAAGIDWEDSQGRRADFHALRHTYGTMLGKSGVSPRETMELMRHTDLRQTTRYTDPRLFSLNAAVEKLPPLQWDKPQAAAATGTHGSAVAPTVATPLTKPHGIAPTCTVGPKDAVDNLPIESNDSRPFVASGADMQGEGESWGTRIRTYNESSISPTNQQYSSEQSSTAGSNPPDSDLQRVTLAWPNLSPTLRAHIIQLIENARK